MNVLGIITLYTCLILSFSYDNGLSPKPAMGWNTWCTGSGCGQGGSWNKSTIFDVCTEKEVKSIANSMKSNGMYEAGYRYINLDDCWGAMDRDNLTGAITWDVDRFPSGIPALAKYLHDIGLYLGLYTSAGNETCNHGQRPRAIPGSFGHYYEDAKAFADWGVDYIKIDWCGYNLTNAQSQHSEFSTALNITGRHMWLELCRGYERDEHGNLPEYLPQVSNSWRSANDNWDYWPKMSKQIQSLINQSFLAGPHNWNYGDFLMTGGAGCYNWPSETIPAHCPGQTDAEYESQFSIYSIVGSPLIVATDIRDMTSVMKRVLLNKLAISVNQDYQTRPGELLCNFSDKKYHQVWWKLLSDANKAAVIFYNGEDEDIYSVKFGMSYFGSWFDKDSISALDIWSGKTYIFSQNIKIKSIPSHSVKYFILEKTNDKPEKLLTWEIISIVIAGFAFIMVVGFLLYRKYFPRESDYQFLA